MRTSQAALEIFRMQHSHFRNSRDQFGLVSRALHWVIALVIILLCIIANIMHAMEPGPDKWQLYDVHKSIGVIILGLVLNPSYGWLGVFMIPVKAMDALVPLWGLYLYVMLAVNAFSERVSLPVSFCFVAALIFGRLAIETLSGWALLYLREHYIRPRLGFRQNLIAASLVPLNALFHRILWLAYSLTAHWRLVTRRRRRHVMGRRGFQGV
jgi:hypothetical protein